jgi:hypothetical protein
MKKLTTVPDFTKKEPRDGTTTKSNRKNSRRETRSYYSTPESSSSVKVSYIANGKDHSPSSTHQCTMRSPFKTMMVTLLKLMVKD